MRKRKKYVTVSLASQDHFVTWLAQEKATVLKMGHVTVDLTGEGEITVNFLAVQAMAQTAVGKGSVTKRLALVSVMKGGRV